MRRNPFDDGAGSRAARMRLGLLLAFALVVVAAVPAGAHGPPTKRDQDFRLLADHNDDCGGDSGTLPNCHGSHDLVGLDVLERHDGGLGDVVVFRFILNGGSGTLKDVLTLKAGSTTKTFELHTTDNKDFSKSVGFASVSGPIGINDGDRFIVEASVRIADLGGATTLLKDYRVDAYVGGSRGDYMPGGYVNGLGVDNPNPSQGEVQTNFIRTNGYVLTGPTYYTTVTLPPVAKVAADGEAVIDVGLSNPFRNTGQLATVTVDGADGFTATWVGANGDAPAEEDLLKGGSATAELRLRGDGHPPATGTLTLTVTTSLGGRSVHSLPYEITAAQVADPTPTSGSAADKDAPVPAAALLAVGLLALARLRRTR